jgi:radical SAM protein
MGPGPDFDRSPFLVIWEVTRACALACQHCRADAIARRDPRELTTAEAFSLVDQVRAFGEPPPVLVLTGGDPMWRKDLADIVGYARQAGLTVALTPSGTAAATGARLRELKDAGLARLAVSLDGPDAATHDRFRGVAGSYMWTMRIIEQAIALDLPLQINTTVSRTTLPTLRPTARRIAELPVTLWAVFFLVQTGRGASLDQVSAAECEDVLEYLYELSQSAPFGIKTTEAPQYRRVVWQHDETRSGTPALQAPGRPQLRAPRAVNDGNGFVFVDHVGNICPSGFLPAVCGNVRAGSLAATYRDDPAFRALRNPDLLNGKCGRCRFRMICGGSRSRAYAEAGDMLGSDSLCAYVPGPSVEPPVGVRAGVRAT